MRGPSFAQRTDMNPISGLRDLLWRSTRHWLSALGIFISAVGGLAFLAVFMLQLTGLELGPYAGVISYLIMPAIFAFGLLLVPIGLFLLRRRERAGKPTVFPVFDLNQPRFRTLALVVMIFTIINLLVISTASYKGLEVLHSDQFCGGACHSVMEPEAVAHGVTPHANVYCADCHVGEGAAHFAKSKLRGVTQMWQFMTGDVKRPAEQPTEVPMVNCTRCHADNRYVEDRLKIHKQYSDDEKPVEKTTVWRMRVGGLLDGKWQGGAHAHNGMKIRYLADRTRENITQVEVVKADGSKNTFTSKEAKTPEGAKWFEMSCTDCHNRPAHGFANPEKLVDAAIARGALDPELPFIRKQALALLKAPYVSRDAAVKGITDGMRTFYATKSGPDAVKVDQATKVLVTAWSNNNFPQMNVNWGTYRDYLQHEPGCYRCHDKKHEDAKGDKIQQKCSGTCHEVIATEEEKPEVMDVLFP